MPQRFLRPGITTSDAWNQCSFPAQSMYIRILTLVDDFGRHDARLPILHGQCFALRPDVKPQQTAAFRSELHNQRLITVYMVDGKEFLQVEKWKERTRSNKSHWPDPQDSAAVRCDPLPPNAIVPAIRHKPSPVAHSEEFLAFWSLYPRKVGKEEAWNEWRRINPDSRLRELICSAISLQAQNKEWLREDMKYVVHPCRWLERKRWLDEAKPKINPSDSW